MVWVTVAAQTPPGYLDADPFNCSVEEVAVQHGAFIHTSASLYMYSVNDSSNAPLITPHCCHTARLRLLVNSQ